MADDDASSLWPLIQPPASAIAADVPHPVPPPNGTPIPGDVPSVDPAAKSPHEKQLELVRKWRAAGVKLLHVLGGTDPNSGQKGPMGSPELTLALRDLQSVEHWARRHITGEPKD